MTMKFPVGALVAVMLAGSPVLAQAGAVPGSPAGCRDMGPRGPMFTGMSEAGRRAVTQAFHPHDERDNADHERVRQARDRMLVVLSADKLDVTALRKAMDDERVLSTAMRARRQADVLQALQHLSASDRRAFVADARAMRGRFEHKGKDGRGRGRMDDGPPPF